MLDRVQVVAIVIVWHFTLALCLSHPRIWKSQLPSSLCFQHSTCSLLFRWCLKVVKNSYRQEDVVKFVPNHSQSLNYGSNICRLVRRYVTNFPASLGWNNEAEHTMSKKRKQLEKASPQRKKKRAKKEKRDWWSPKWSCRSFVRLLPSNLASASKEDLLHLLSFFSSLHLYIWTNSVNTNTRLSLCISMSNGHGWQKLNPDRLLWFRPPQPSMTSHYSTAATATQYWWSHCSLASFNKRIIYKQADLCWISFSFLTLLAFMRVQKSREIRTHPLSPFRSWQMLLLLQSRSRVTDNSRPGLRCMAESLLFCTSPPYSFSK